MKWRNRVLPGLSKFKPSKEIKKRGAHTFHLTEELILGVTDRLFTIGKYFNLKPEELLIVLMAIQERMQASLGVNNIQLHSPEQKPTAQEEGKDYE